MNSLLKLKLKIDDKHNNYERNKMKMGIEIEK